MPFFFGYLSSSDPSNLGKLGLEQAKLVSRQSQANPIFSQTDHKITSIQTVKDIIMLIMQTNVSVSGLALVSLFFL